jgi:hypothetical protein
MLEISSVGEQMYQQLSWARQERIEVRKSIVNFDANLT